VRHPIFDLLGVRYVIGEPYDALAIPGERKIPPGETLEVPVDVGGGAIHELLLVSCTDYAASFPTGTEVAEFSIENASGEKRTVPIRTGIETADFRLSMPGFPRGQKPAPIHRRVSVLVPEGRFTGQVYVSRVSFDPIRSPIRFRFRNTTGRALFIILEASLTFVPDGRFRRVYEDDRIPAGAGRLYENSRCFPRAWWVGRGIRAASGSAARTMLVKGTFDPGTSVLLEQGAGEEPGGELEGGREGEWTVPPAADVAAYGPGLLEVEVNAPAPGYLVASEMDDFGWHVTVDGKPADRLRANGIMMAAAVDAGRHRVRFRFVPEDALAGGAVSILALGVLALVLVRDRRARGSDPSPGAQAG